MKYQVSQVKIVFQVKIVGQAKRLVSLIKIKLIILNKNQSKKFKMNIKDAKMSFKVWCKKINRFIKN